MTLKNAKHRFAEIGCEVEKGLPPYKYRYRTVGGSWYGGNCLELLLTAATLRVQQTRRSKHVAR
jgi:hypothetical protein